MGQEGAADGRRGEGQEGGEQRGSGAERRRSARLGSLALERGLAAPLKGLGERLAEPLAMLAGVAEHLCP